MATFSDLQIDALREMGNIGSGNAATSLSTLLQKTVDLNLTEVSVLSVQECLDRIGFPDTQICSTMLDITGEYRGFLWFAMSKEDHEFIAVSLAGEAGKDDPSVIHEVANILAGNYLMALGTLIQVTLDMGLPVSADIMTFLKNPKYFWVDRTATLFIQNALKVEGRTLSCQINLILDRPSIQKLFKRIGLS